MAERSGSGTGKLAGGPHHATDHRVRHVRSWDVWRRRARQRSCAVAAVIDTRTEAATDFTGAARIAGARVIQGAQILSTVGAREVKAVDVAVGPGRRERIACDLVAVSNGWDPTIHLTSHLGAKPVW